VSVSQIEELDVLRMRGVLLHGAPAPVAGKLRRALEDAGLADNEVQLNFVPEERLHLRGAGET
jgi:hypothetical protein